MNGKAVLLINLGSPDSPSIPDVRRYLKEFLSDERVLDAPAPIRNAVLYTRILPFRPKSTSEAYQRVWEPEGSPLIRISRRVQGLLQEKTELPVELAMRYGNPSIADTLEKMARKDLREIFVIPLYPHYAMSSYETVVVKVQAELEAINPGVRLSFQQPFYAEPDYIEALYQRSKSYLEKEYDLLLFSFHGIPERHLRKGDPSKAHCMVVRDCCHTCSPVHAVCYRAQCLRTVTEFVARAGIDESKYAVSFQSRLGREPWLTPYTDKELERLPQAGGVKKILVISPAFVSDCLETIEELGITGKESFLEAGGESFNLIPCLNDHPAWIDFLATRIDRFSQATAQVLTSRAP
ncbi:MAG: ferrochelatase [Opitutales bacterium]